ncbi:hypothetical protein ElyMa_001121600 [Elysia marginata]|uniref:Uncharacterized protein n=1 Tax=Elysia marginata TaxID=1093978 RepID=A0AAV4HXA5_9GAST|nr:hypothetical protein ElyMa_001121600 [Elysia marginata]
MNGRNYGRTRIIRTNTLCIFHILGRGRHNRLLLTGHEKSKLVFFFWPGTLGSVGKAWLTTRQPQTCSSPACWKKYASRNLAPRLATIVFAFLPESVFRLGAVPEAGRDIFVSNVCARNDPVVVEIDALFRGIL